MLFTNPTPDDKEFETLAFTDMIKVTVSFKTELENNMANKSKSSVVKKSYNYRYTQS